MIKLFRRLFQQAPRIKNILSNDEGAAIDQLLFHKNPQALIDLMVARREPFRHTGRYHWSSTGRIHICMNIYGPEVKIDGRGMIDCYPHEYNLTYETAKAVYSAILSNVGGTTDYAKKHKSEFV